MKPGPTARAFLRVTPSTPPEWLLPRQHGAVLLVAAQPGSRHTELVGLHDGALRIRVAAPAIEGRANDALRSWLAQRLGCSRGSVHMLRGDKSRRKQVMVDLPAAEVRARIEELLAQAQSAPR
jgi:uncharacterized protein (TIGR00251 family)